MGSQYQRVITVTISNLIMKTLTPAVLLVLPLLTLADIAQVKYLGGITFLLKDRCPESATAGEISRYEQCAANEILHTQCVTDRLKTGDKLTVPVFTDLCSAVCWGESVARIHDCPYNGRRLDGKGNGGSQKVDQALADRFLG